jgi:hypothetical protein
MQPIRFVGEIRYWNPEKGSGLAVVDVPADGIVALGGPKQQRVSGTLAGAAFTSNVAPAGGGRLALSVSKAMMAVAGVGLGDRAAVVIIGVGRE